MYIIPLTSDPDQKFRCVIPVDGKNLPLRFEIRYNSIAKCWHMTVTDDLSGEMLMDSIPLMSGMYPSGNLLEQFGYLKIGSCCMVKTDPDIAPDDADDNTLGTGFALCWDDTL